MTRVAVTLGDICGIGPEVILKTLIRHSRLRSRCLLIGDPSIVRRELRRAGLSPDRLLREVHDPEEARGKPGAIWILAMSHPGLLALPRGRVSALAGQQAAAWISAGTTLTLQGRLTALVTGPVNKAAVAQAVPGFRGHTEYIARLAGTPFPVMMLVGPALRVVPVTRHLPLTKVPRALSASLIARSIVETARGLKRWFRIARPRIVVCGLNPHAGENGLLGSEERSMIAPAVKRAVRQRIRVTGPFPADTVFAAALNGGCDAVVAMYHDQAQIPIKTLEPGRAVNVTLGLPFLRTSPAHGTAFDIAGRGVADPTSMRAAIELALGGVPRPG